MKIFKKKELNKKDWNALMNTRREIGILGMLNHKNIIKLYETIEEEINF